MATTDHKYCAVCQEPFVHGGNRRTCGHPRCVRTWNRHSSTIKRQEDYAVKKVREFLDHGHTMGDAIDQSARLNGLRRVEVLSRWKAVHP